MDGVGSRVGVGTLVGVGNLVGEGTGLTVGSGEIVEVGTLVGARVGVTFGVGTLVGKLGEGAVIGDLVGSFGVGTVGTLILVSCRNRSIAFSVSFSMSSHNRSKGFSWGCSFRNSSSFIRFLDTGFF